MEDETDGAPEAEIPESQDANDGEDSSSSSDATQAQADDVGSDDEAGDDKPKKKGGFQRRIDKVVRRAQTAETALAVERAERERLQAAIDSGATTAAKEDPQPARDQFEDYEAFLDARARWVARAEWRTQEQARQQTERESATKRESIARAETWDAQVEDAIERYSDFNEVALSQDLAVSPAMAGVLTEADDGADILYWLGKNPDESAKLARQSAKKVAISIGRLGERLANERKRTKSEAPKPPASVRGSSAGVPSGLSDSASTAAWMKARREQLDKRRA